MQALLSRAIPSDFLLSSVLVVSGLRHAYPQSRVTKIIISPDQTHPLNVDVQPSLATPVLRQINTNQNVMPTPPSLEVLKPFSPLSIEPKRENAYGLAPMAHPCVASVARRTALGCSTGKSSTDQKENVGQGAVMTPGDTLRLDLVVLLLLHRIVHRVPSRFKSWFHLIDMFLDSMLQSHHLAICHLQRIHEILYMRIF